MGREERITWLEEPITVAEVRGYFNSLHELMGPVMRQKTPEGGALALFYDAGEDTRAFYIKEHGEETLTSLDAVLIMTILERLAAEYDWTTFNIDYEQDPLIEVKRALDTFTNLHVMGLITDLRPFEGGGVAKFTATPQGNGLLYQLSVDGITVSGHCESRDDVTAFREAQELLRRRVEVIGATLEYRPSQEVR